MLFAMAVTNTALNYMQTRGSRIHAGAGQQSDVIYWNVILTRVKCVVKTMMSWI